jgi:serine/threonine protein kinase
MNYGRYQVVKELGKGSMGMVYQAHDPEIDRLIALKVLRQDRLTSEDFVQRFLKEARAIGRLSHPNIVTVYDVGQDHGTIYIAMEFLEGKSLDQLIAEKNLRMEEILNLGIQVAETLDYAHQKGIVHRDVKPSNIIVQANSQIKITDFGIAHIEDPSAPVQTQAGEILGTPAYMSPEQASSRPVDGRSDLFSLGVILYELSAGKRPFAGANLAAIFQAVTQEHPLPPSKVNPSLDEVFSRMVMKCLEKIPEKRFTSGKALGESLRSLGAGRESPAKATPGVPQKRKNIFYVVSIAVLFVGMLAGLFYYLSAPKKIPPPVAESPLAVEKVKPALLKVESSPPEAQIFIDGVFKGKTPANLEIPAGKHEVRIILPDHYDWEAQVQLQEEGETPLRIRLIPMAEKKP